MSAYTQIYTKTYKTWNFWTIASIVNFKKFNMCFMFLTQTPIEPKSESFFKNRFKPNVKFSKSIKVIFSLFCSSCKLRFALCGRFLALCAHAHLYKESDITTQMWQNVSMTSGPKFFQTFKPGPTYNSVGWDHFFILSPQMITERGIVQEKLLHV